MSSLRNRVTLIGHLGADPEIKTFESGQLARFSLATNETYKNSKGEKETDTQWHNVVAFGKLSELVSKYTKKGQEIALEGKLVNRQYEDKEGQKRYAVEVHMQEMVLLGSGKSGQ